MAKLLNEHLPLIAFDAELLLQPIKGFFGIKKFSVNEAVELGCVKLREHAAVTILCQYLCEKQFTQAQDTLNPLAFNYFVRTASQFEFEMFRDRNLPHQIYSNIPRKWKGTYSDVLNYPEKDAWIFVFEHLRETILF